MLLCHKKGRGAAPAFNASFLKNISNDQENEKIMAYSSLLFMGYCNKKTGETTADPYIWSVL
jgi:hypothetical protein